MDYDSLPIKQRIDYPTGLLYIQGSLQIKDREIFTNSLSFLSYSVSTRCFWFASPVPFHMSDHHLAKGSILGSSRTMDSGIRSILIRRNDIFRYQYSVPDVKTGPLRHRVPQSLGAFPSPWNVYPRALRTGWVLILGSIEWHYSRQDTGDLDRRSLSATILLIDISFDLISFNSVPIQTTSSHVTNKRRNVVVKIWNGKCPDMTKIFSCNDEADQDIHSLLSIVYILPHYTTDSIPLKRVPQQMDGSRMKSIWNENAFVWQPPGLLQQFLL